MSVDAKEKSINLLNQFIAIHQFLPHITSIFPFSLLRIFKVWGCCLWLFCCCWGFLFICFLFGFGFLWFFGVLVGFFCCCFLGFFSLFYLKDREIVTVGSLYSNLQVPRLMCSHGWALVLCIDWKYQELRRIRFSSGQPK